MPARQPLPDPADSGDSPAEPEIPHGPAADDPRLQIPDVLRNPGPAQPTKAPSRTAEAVQMGKAWGTAMNFVFTILGGAILGWLIDRWRGTTPTGALIGLSLGFILAFYTIIRATKAQERAEQERRKTSGPR